MRKPGIFILLTLVVLFLFASTIRLTPGSSVYACSGYSIATGLCCECEEEGCVCGDTRPVSEPKGKDSALGSESLIVLAALLLWLRIRAN